MKKFLAMALALSFAGIFTSCNGDDDDDDVVLTPELAISTATAALEAVVSIDESATGATDATIYGWTLAANKGQLGGSDNTPATASTAAPVVNVTANISANTTWSKDTVYQLDTRVTVLDGVTLTIQAGTVVKGNSSLSGANAAVLMVARGGKLMAEGTATAPIIMTSTDDNIQPGDLLGNTLDQDAKGKWGGLVVLGKAPVSAKTENPQIEGVDATDTNGQYGGSDAADNSGVIKYVSVRHGGAIIAEGSEINGLTLGGVGSGTTIENIEIYGNSDDGIEFFGGTVNVKNVLVYAVGDDGLDVDQSYAGTIDNFVVYTDSNSDEGLEIDGREGAMDASFVIKNGNIYGVSGAATTADFKAKAKGSVTNVVFENGAVKLSASFDTESYEQTEDAAKNTIDGSLTFSKVNASAFELYTKSFE